MINIMHNYQVHTEWIPKTLTQNVSCRAKKIITALILENSVTCVRFTVQMLAKTNKDANFCHFNVVTDK